MFPVPQSLPQGNKDQSSSDLEKDPLLNDSTSGKAGPASKSKSQNVSNDSDVGNEVMTGGGSAMVVWQWMNCAEWSLAIINPLAVNFYNIMNIPNKCVSHIKKQFDVDRKEGCHTKLATKHAANFEQTSCWLKEGGFHTKLATKHASNFLKTVLFTVSIGLKDRRRPRRTLCVTIVLVPYVYCTLYKYQ